MTLKQRLLRGGAVLFVATIVSGLFFLTSPIVSAGTPTDGGPLTLPGSNPLPGGANSPEGAFNVVVAPPSIGLQAKPGTTVSTDIKVQNQGLSTERIKVSVMKFSANGQDGTPALLDLEEGDEFAKWIRFDRTSFNAEPNVWESVKVSISPPAGAAYGYYYAVIFSRQDAEKQIKPSQSNLLGAVASLVLLDVESPNAKRVVKVTEFSTDARVKEFLPADFTVRLRNKGNVHVAARGNVIITKGNETVAILEVNLRKGYILPDTYRKFTAAWEDGSPLYKARIANNKVMLDDKGNQLRELKWDKFNMGKLRYGKYHAKLVMVYDDGKGDVSTEAHLDFWVIPWRIMAVLGLITLLVLAGLYALVIRPARQRLQPNRQNYRRGGRF